MTESDIYLSRGVSSSKKEIHSAIKNVDPGLFPGAFCKVLPDRLTNDPDYCLLMHADGAGTKSSLAYIYWKETGDLSVFSDIAVDSLVMNLDDLVCTGAVDRYLLSNTIGRNKFRIPGEVIQAVIEGFRDVIEKLSILGITIDFCGGETADVGDLVRTIIVDSTLTTRARKSDIINLENVAPGDVIIGFSSSGKAAWEENYNSGIGSNGLTAARHDSLSGEYAEKYPESFSREMPNHLVYCGKGKLTDPLEGTPLTLGKALLSPTRTYAPLIREVLVEYRPHIHGIIHCTGGGQTKCLHFGKNIHYIKSNLFELPAIFRFIRDQNNLKPVDLYPVYNMGHRMELFTEEKYAEGIIDLSNKNGIEAQIIGYCEQSENGKNRLTIIDEGETFQYG